MDELEMANGKYISNINGVRVEDLYQEFKERILSEINNGSIHLCIVGDEYARIVSI